MDITGVAVDKKVAEAIAYAFKAGQEKERERIYQEIKAIEQNSARTRTPVFQDYFFSKAKEIILNANG